jgi:hypothetical protein
MIKLLGEPSTISYPIEDCLKAALAQLAAKELAYALMMPLDLTEEMLTIISSKEDKS